MFLGDQINCLDPKNRLFIPARFREELGSSFAIIPAPEGCIFILTKERWENIVSDMEEKTLTPRDRERQRRAMVGATTVSSDKQGRITITPYLVKHAGLKKDVMVFGAGSRIELWDLDRWNKMINDVEVDEDGVVADGYYPEIKY